VQYFVCSCLRCYFDHQMETLLSISKFRFIGKQYVVEASESGLKYDTKYVFHLIFL
jgi:hypothetical protein